MLHLLLNTSGLHTDIDLAVYFWQILLPLVRLRLAVWHIHIYCADMGVVSVFSFLSVTDQTKNK